MTFLLVFLLLMTLISTTSYYLRKVHVPGVVAAMLVGIVISRHSIFLPAGFDLIDYLNHWLDSGYPTIRLYSTIDAMAQLGLIFLMALAGMEVSIRLLLAEKRAVALLSAFTFALPALVGYRVYAAFYPESTIGKWVFASLFASHSIGIAFPLIREAKLSGTRFGITVLAATVITDIASLILFAVCVQLKRMELATGESVKLIAGISLFDKLNLAAVGNWFIPLFVGVIVLFIALALWLVPKIAKQITAQIAATDDLRLTFFLVVVLAVVFTGELLGVSALVGAFVAGMALVQAPGFHDHGRILFKKMEGIGYGLIIPIMFLNIGLQTDLRVLLIARENLNIVLITVGALVCSKVVAGFFALWFAGFSKIKGLCAGLMTTPQLASTLAAAEVAKRLEMITPASFNAIIVLSIMTTIPIPPIVKLLITRWKVKFDRANDRDAAMATELVHGESVSAVIDEKPKKDDADYVETYI